MKTPLALAALPAWYDTGHEVVVFDAEARIRSHVAAKNLGAHTCSRPAKPAR